MRLQCKSRQTPKQGDGKTTGELGLGERNERGERRVQFATFENLKITNTFFEKKPQRKWTWRSPNGETKNQIDFILTNRGEMILNTEVIQRLNAGTTIEWSAAPSEQTTD